MLLTLLIVSLLFSLVSLQPITEVNQKIRFINKKNNETEGLVELINLQYYQTASNIMNNFTVSSNRTIEDQDGVTMQKVLLCYVNDTNGTNYDIFETDCLNNKTKKAEDKDALWVLISSVGSHQDQNLDVVKNASNFTESKIYGVILSSKSYPRELDSNIKNESKKFEDPKLINFSFDLDDLNEIYSNYSWNTMN